MEILARSRFGHDQVGAFLAALLLVAVVAFGAIISIAGAPPNRLPEDLTRSNLFSTEIAAAPEGPAPVLESLEVAPIAPADAKAINDKVPFASGPNPPALPFVFTGSIDDLARATDCLAAAALYEAGDDRVGEQAVAQVVLNRARHPAFPASVCGVVFQGSERRSGCQFTFTCDGALARRYSEGAWERARAIAAAALSGFVFEPVGLATHYHTNWVVPYWSSSLEKIASVGTHLFFRWSGGWGLLPAFRQRITMIEAPVSKLAAISPLHLTELQTLPAFDTLDKAVESVPALPPSHPLGAKGVLTANDAAIVNSAQRDAIILTLDRGEDPNSFEGVAKRQCGDKSYCKVLGWTNAELVGTATEITDDQRRAMAYSYLRNDSTGFEKSLWNCKIFPRADKRTCMRGI